MDLQRRRFVWPGSSAQFVPPNPTEELFPLSRITLAASALALALAAAPAAQDPQDALREKFTKKLESEFLAKADWVTDYDVARAKAKEQGKLILGYFTRSYSP